MESQTASELLRGFEERLTKLEVLLETPAHCSLKERRQHATETMPFPDFLKPYLPLELNMPGDHREFNQLADDYYEALLEPLEFATRRSNLLPFPFKVSSKVIGPGLGQTHVDRVFGAIRRVTKRQGVDYITFERLCAELGYAEEWGLATSGPPQTWSFLRATLSVLSTPLDDREARDRFDRLYRQTPATAVLKSKPVINRCELRAYVADKDVLSSVCGAIIHAVIHPQDKGVRDSFKYSRVWKTKGKNILQNTLAVRSRDEVLEVFGDVSSFTGSMRNLWTATISMLAFLQFLGASGKSTVVKMLLKGSTIITDLRDVFRIFLYLNFRRKVYDEALAETFVSEGGMLGITGVNTLANIVFACLQKALSHLVDRWPRTLYQPQNGGDDFRSIIRSSSSFRNLEVVSLVKRLVTRYIGVFSEFDFWVWRAGVAPHRSLYVISKFCKKTVRLDFTQGLDKKLIMTWQSQWSLPLLSALLEGPSYRKRADFPELASAYAQSVLSSVPWVPEKELLISYLIRLFHLIHGPLVRKRQLWPSENWSTPSLRIKENHTQGAADLIETYDFGLGPDGLPLYDTWDARELVLVRKGLLRKGPVIHGDDCIYLTYLPADVKLMRHVPALSVGVEESRVHLPTLFRLAARILKIEAVTRGYRI